MKWTPITEGLPKKGGDYLISTDWGSVLIKSFSKNLRSVDRHDFKEKKSGWYSYDSEYGYYEWHNVVAWMPLPKAYKAEGSDKK